MGVIDLDPCSNSHKFPNVPAVKHYTAEDNGLVQPWEGRIFLNPPFGHCVERWFSKLYQERSTGRTTEAIVLWKSATETAAWKTLTAISCRVCFPSARIRFAGPAGDSGPGPTFSPALFYVGNGPEWFEAGICKDRYGLGLFRESETPDAKGPWSKNYRLLVWDRLNFVLFIVCFQFCF